MSRFQSVNLADLPVPDFVEVLDFEATVEQIRADFLERYPEAGAVILESEPVAKLIECMAYRDMQWRERANDSLRAWLLATSWGGNLDHLGAEKMTARKMLDAGDPTATPPIPPTYEDDDAFRERIQLAWEGLSTAGPSDGYRYFALSAHPMVREVSVISPEPVDVILVIQSMDNDGIASAEILDSVTAAVADNRTVRPLTDKVSVRAGSQREFDVAATLHVESGPDSLVVQEEARKSVNAYIATRATLGVAVTRSSLIAALTVAGVWKVELNTPPEDVAPTPDEFAVVREITLSLAGDGA